MGTKKPVGPPIWFGMIVYGGLGPVKTGMVLRMIIKRALFREAAINTIGITLILFIFMFFLGITRLLGKITIGGHASQVITQIFGLKMIQSIDTMLPLALFLGVLLAVGRWYRDNEMAVLAACGVSLKSLLRPLLALAAVVALFVAAVSMWVSPWAALTIERLHQSSTQTMAFSGIRQGVFSEMWPSRRTYFIEEVDRDNKSLNNVFISGLAPAIKYGERQVTIYAAKGAYETDDKTGQRYLVLLNGHVYEGAPGSADYQIISFDRYRARMGEAEIIGSDGDVEYMNIVELWRDGSVQANSRIHWHLARPIAVMILAVIALVLAHTDPRRGRFTNLFIAIFVFFLYSNLLGVGTDMLTRGRLPMALGLWWVHISFLLLAVYMLWRRNNNMPLIPAFGRAR
ncbi:MAG: LPS export ABC transporter permease LptF [Proteobacteria bacterium]|nr:LPS export ABC transporter permease LptF [Pseudomonadota bacterium]